MNLKQLKAWHQTEYTKWSATALQLKRKMASIKSEGLQIGHRSAHANAEFHRNAVLALTNAETLVKMTVVKNPKGTTE